MLLLISPGYVSFSLVCRGRQTKVRGECNVQQAMLQKIRAIIFKIKMANVAGP